MKHKIATALFLSSYLGLNAQSPLSFQLHEYTISYYRYWFDKEEKVKETSYVNGISNLDATTLDEGFHMLHYQVVDSKGEVSPVRSFSFFKIAAEDKGFKDYVINNIQYWFDKEEKVKETSYVNGISNLDATTLDEGFHMLHYQVVDSKGEVSPVRSFSFFKIAAEDKGFKDYVINNIQYWFDKEEKIKETSYVNGISNLDATTLDEGFHMLHYQVVDSKGEVSPVRSFSFFKIAAEDKGFKDYEINNIQYWFDKEKKIKEASYSNGISNIDVATLDEGFHILHYQVVDNKGEVSPVRSTSFFRVAKSYIPFKEYAIKEVHYWFDNKKETTLIGEYRSGITELDLSTLKEGDHTIHYQIVADNGELSPIRTALFERSLYDIYVKNDTLYTQGSIAEGTNPDLKLHYKLENVNVRGHLTTASDAVISLGKYVQTAHWGRNNGEFTQPGPDYYHPTSLINQGFMRADSVIIKQNLYNDQWHFLSFPFNVKVADIGIPEGTYMALRTYDGEQRAAGNAQETWVDISSDDTMEAGRGYILQFLGENYETSAEFTFKSINDVKKNDLFTTDNVSIPLEEHQSEFAHNRSWNLIGNPYPCFYDSRFMKQKGNITVWNGKGYSAYSLTDDHYVLMPFEAFFLQKPLDAENVEFDISGRQHYSDARTLPNRIATKHEPTERLIYNFTLTDGNSRDRFRLVINENASLGYETDKDAVKFMEELPRIAQLYSEEGGVKYAINERPLQDGTLIISIYTPSDGYYTLTLENTPNNVTLFDTQTKDVVSLNESGYTFHALKGTNKARFILSLNGNISSTTNVEISEDGDIKTNGNNLSFSFLKPKHVQVWGSDGRIYYNQTTDREHIRLNSGIYIVSIDGRNTKIVIR